jgi:hypothetical protein
VNPCSRITRLRGIQSQSRSTPGRSPACSSASSTPAGAWSSQACAVLLAAVGGEPPDPTPVRDDAAADLGAAGPDGVNTQPLTEEIRRRDGARAERCPRKTEGSGPSPIESGRVRGFTTHARNANEIVAARVRVWMLPILGSQNGNPASMSEPFCNAGHERGR